MEVSDELKTEIEQNTNILYHETRTFVSEMQPSLTVATIAFDMLYREATRELIMADWSEAQISEHMELVDKIINKNIMKAFNDSAVECDLLVNPPISEDVILMPTSHRPH